MYKVFEKNLLCKLGMAIQSPKSESLVGNLGARIEDFVVKEVPLYEPIGSGEHGYYLLEKKGRTTLACVSEIAKFLNIKEVDIGYAGLKDKHGITIRLTSKEAPVIKSGGFSMQYIGRHQNKIKIGHLKGNQFTLLLENLEKDYPVKLQKKIEWLSQNGIPNYFGTQRFGNRGNNHLAGISVLKKNFKDTCHYLIGDPEKELNKQAFQARELYEKGEYQESFETFPPYFVNERKMIKEIQKGENKEKRAYLKCDRKTREFLFNAAQSYLFNLYVTERISRGLKLLKGDVALLDTNHAPFIVEDPEVENIRFKAGEINLGGPLFGYRMVPASGVSLEIENLILDSVGMTLDDFATPSVAVKFQGARRPVSSKLSFLSFREMTSSSAEVSFFLPAGSYATVVLQEIFNVVQEK